MSDENETPENIDEPEIEGVDADDLANLDVDPDDLDEETTSEADEADDTLGGRRFCVIA